MNTDTQNVPTGAEPQIPPLNAWLLNVLYLIDHMHNLGSLWGGSGCSMPSLLLWTCILDHALGQMGIQANTKYQSAGGNPTTIGN